MTSQATSTTPLSLSELSSLLVECQPAIVGSAETLVERTTEDSRRVEKGSLFVARSGEKVDGTRYVEAAFDAGAAAILCERGAPIERHPRIEVSQLRRAWGIAAHALCGQPSHALSTVGITGTNGKTTVASLVAQALAQMDHLVARSGTLGFFLGDERVADSLTTPQPDQLAASLALARDRGADCAVMEVSSHALDQERIAGVRFQVVALTNLTQDHLDYHGSMENYGAAKAKLFSDYGASDHVLNLDDAFGRSLFAEHSAAWGISAEGRKEATIRARDAHFGRRGLSAWVQTREKEVFLRSPLLGQHNLENLLTAWGVLEAMGKAPDLVAKTLERCPGVPGRLERCDGEQDDIVVVVDYAHTEDALRRALISLQELRFDSVVCVFGCGGDRDPKKRAPMGRVAAEYADRIFLTSDNPRSENPAEILHQVSLGLSGAETRSQLIEDRREAIQRSILEARTGEVVLIAGKGHEDYQLVGDQTLPFDDRYEARSALALRREGRG